MTLSHPPQNDEAKIRFVTTTTAEKKVIEWARDDPYWFCYYVLGKEPARHHRIWLSNIFHPERKRINIIAFRESAKSTYAVASLAYLIGKNPLLTNAIVSVSSKQAEDRMRMLKSIIESPAFKNVFPNIVIDPHLPVTQTEFSVMRTDISYSAWRTIVAQHGSLKDPTVKTSGVGGRSLIGSRFSGFLILDDIMDTNSLGDANMDKLWTYLVQELVPMVQAEAKIIHISTRWQIGDICDRMRALDAYYTIDIPIRIHHPVTGELVPTWPEFWPLDQIEKKRAEMGDDDTLFRLMYLNDPTASATSLFRLEHIYHSFPVEMPEFTGIYIGTDFAFSDKTRSDWNVFLAIGITKSQDVYVLDGVRFRSNVSNNIVDNLAYFSAMIATKYERMDGILIEKVTMNVTMRQLIDNHPRRSIMPYFMVPLIGDKASRAENPSTWAKNGKLYFNQKMHILKQIQIEYLNFGTYRWDDTLDALSLFFLYKGLNLGSVTKLHRVRSSFLL